MNDSSPAAYRAAEARLWQQYDLAPTEHFLRLPGLNTTVRVLEIGTGEPTLFVHGSPNAAPKWAPLVAQLAGTRCLLLDRPGCGLSAPVDYRGRDVRAFGADLLAQTLDALGLEQADVVASSLGGALAFFFAQAHPARVRRLVQEGCPAFVNGFHVPAYNLMSTVLGLLFGTNPPSRAAFRHIGHAHSIDNGTIAEGVLQWRDALLRHTDTLRNENGLNRNIARHGRAYRYGPELLGQLAMPTLYLWGEDDPFGGAEVARRAAAAQPNAELHLFPHAGHLPWLDDPAAHGRLLRAFLQPTVAEVHP